MLSFTFDRIPRSILTVVIGHIVITLPYALLVLIPRLEQIDSSLKPGDLELIARTKDAYIYENPRALPRVMLLGLCTIAGGLFGPTFFRRKTQLGIAMVVLIAAYAASMLIRPSTLSLAPQPSSNDIRRIRRISTTKSAPWSRSSAAAWRCSPPP